MVYSQPITSLYPETLSVNNLELMINNETMTRNFRGVLFKFNATFRSSCGMAKSFKGRGRLLQKPPKDSGVYFGHFATFAPFFYRKLSFKIKLSLN